MAEYAQCQSTSFYFPSKNYAKARVLEVALDKYTATRNTHLLLQSERGEGGFSPRQQKFEVDECHARQLYFSVRRLTQGTITHLHMCIFIGTHIYAHVVTF